VLSLSKHPGVRNYPAAVRGYRTGLFRNTLIRKGIKPNQGQTFFFHFRFVTGGGVGDIIPEV
jgi:hypothetical protein